MKLTKQILTQNDCYRAGRTIRPRGVMVHSTGANNPNTSRYTTAWNKPDVKKCAHAFVGYLSSESILRPVGTVQTLPWNWRGWHAGTGTNGGSANDTHISFEICEDDLTDPLYFRAVYREAVELTAYLCKQYGLDPSQDGVVICHAEGHTRGVASNHADVMHWFPRFGKDMDGFRADVAREMKNDGEDNDMTAEEVRRIAREAIAEAFPTYRTLEDVPEWYAPTVQKLVDKGALKGTGAGELNVNDLTCRDMTILDRLGVLDGPQTPV